MESSSSCGYFEYHTHGRQGIGVSQPQAGTDYPLTQPSTDIRYLLADFHLTFDSPHHYGAGEAFTRPFKIDWLYGFGCESADFPIPTEVGGSLSSWGDICTTSSLSVTAASSYSYADCLPVPAHAQDIIVHDATGRVVFDSTEAGTTYETRDWGDRLKIVMWRQNANAICTVVYHTAWSPNTAPSPRTYKEYFFPEQAVLDSRAIDELPKRVRAFIVVLDTLSQMKVELVSGYNMAITTGDTVTTPGKRRTTAITFNATAGKGLGVFPGCEAEQLFLRTINETAPTEDGRFSIAAGACYWVRQPTQLISEVPRLTAPSITLLPGSAPTANLPDPAAGTVKNLPGWPTDDDPRYAHLQLGNDCGPCCECDDYVTTAEYMNRTRDTYQTVGTVLHNSRTLYHENRLRWLTTASCMTDRALRIRVLPQMCPFIDVAAQFCNQTSECKTNVELILTGATSPTGSIGVEVPGFTYITGAVTTAGGTTGQTERYKMDGTWPMFRAYIDMVQPGASVSVRFRLQFDDCGHTTSSLSAYLGGDGGTVPIAVTMTLTGEAEAVAISGDSGAIEVSDTRTLNCPPPDDATFNPLICACEE